MTCVPAGKLHCSVFYLVLQIFKKIADCLQNLMFLLKSIKNQNFSQFSGRKKKTLVDCLVSTSRQIHGVGPGGLGSGQGVPPGTQARS